jgi:hypothetical protein
MDFPVCPSCGQSVIDDDAKDCPFCGASMSAKPGAKTSPAAAKPAATVTKPTATKPSAAKPGAVKAGGKPTLPGDDFPFEAELTVGKAAIPAMPNPTKQRTLQVVCPMCDTAGYVPPTAAGQDVKCANPKCVMPVFTVPAPKKVEQPPPPPPPKKSNLPFIGGATLVIGLVIGAGLYFINSQPSNRSTVKQGELSEEAKQAIAEMRNGGKKNAGPDRAGIQNSGASQNANGTNKSNGDKASPAVEVAATNEDLINAALKQMKASCLEKDRTQRSKPICRQLTAEANAVTGNFAAARDDLEQLLKVGSQLSYYRISPLLDLFWSEFSRGQQKEAAKSLAAAMSEVSGIPKFGRTRLEIAGRLAAALVASGQMPEALKLMEDFHSSDSDAQLAARLQIATDGRVVRLSNTLTVLPWKYPQAVAATASLIGRGETEKAFAWASGQSSDDAKAECLAIWSEDFAFRKAAEGSPDSDGRIEAAVKSLPPALAARVWARAGFGRWLAKDPGGAAAAIKLAKEKMAEVAAPTESPIPAFKLTDRYTVPKPAPLLQAATGHSEIAFLQAQSAATKADAETSLDAALAYADAMGPSTASAFARQAEEKQLGTIGLRAKLKELLKLRNDDEVFRAANRFKSALDDIVKAAQLRFETQTLILSRLRGTGVGLDSKVWVIVDSRSTAEESKRDNLMVTELPGELVEGLKGTAEEKAILGAWETRFQTTAPPRPASVQFNEMLLTDVEAAVDFVQKIENKGNRRDEILLLAASSLPAANKLPLAFEFISKLDNPNDREECYLLAATIGAQRGQGDVVLKQVSSVVQQTEKVALCRGLIGGLQAAGQQKNDFLKAAMLP